MQEVVVIAQDLAKNVFQVQGIDFAGVVWWQVAATQPGSPLLRGLVALLVGIEARASAHHGGQQRRAIGHEVRLTPPAYVKPYVKRGKTEAADAEAVTRPTMRFVAVSRRF